MGLLEYAIEPTWRMLLKDMGLSASNILKRAELPEDLFNQTSARISAGAYNRLWNSLATELADPLFPIAIGRAISTEAFSPPIFAALCSPDMLTATRRISQYKPLIAPLSLDVVLGEDGGMTLTLEWLDKTNPPPASMVMTEFVFFTQLIRIATREQVSPSAILTPALPPANEIEAYEAYFGVLPAASNAHSISFSPQDTTRPFLTANEGMWEMFEPELKRRLDGLDEEASESERVRAVLLESLPSGLTGMGDVARKLAMSKRTLQRRLSTEGTTFREILQDTREALAKHYLGQTSLSAQEISFLLGFDEPNSFYRAFNDWTGETPDGMRQQLMH